MTKQASSRKPGRRRDTSSDNHAAQRRPDAQETSSLDVATLPQEPEAQAAILGEIPAAQRGQVMASIGRTYGNRHLQRVMRAVAMPPAAAGIVRRHLHRLQKMPHHDGTAYRSDIAAFRRDHPPEALAAARQNILGGDPSGLTVTADGAGQLRRKGKKSKGKGATATETATTTKTTTETTTTPTQEAKAPTQEAKPPTEKKKEEEKIETGLARASSIKVFGKKLKTLYDQWGKLGADKRLGDLTGAVNAELSKTGTPACAARTENKGGGGNAEFDFTVWTIVVDPTYLNKNAITADELADLADAVYHESRHAEQWFRIALLRAGEGLDARKLEEELYIPAKTAEAAAKAPLKALSPEARKVRSAQYVARQDQSIKEAKAWYDSIYGTKATHRNEVLNDLDNRYEDYRKLAEEVDAWAVGTAAKTVVTKVLKQ